MIMSGLITSSSSDAGNGGVAGEHEDGAHDDELKVYQFDSEKFAKKLLQKILVDFLRMD